MIFGVYILVLRSYIVLVLRLYISISVKDVPLITIILYRNHR